MAEIQRFEDVQAWKAGVAFVNQIYRVTAYGAFSQDYTLRNQIRKAAVSIPSNIAEGFERNRRNEFAQFLRYAKGSAGQVRSQLYHARDQGYVSDDTFEALRDEVRRISRQIQVFIQYLEEDAYG